MKQIEVENLDKYYGDFHALKDINLAVEEGTFVALVGPSGCGKSTLLRTLAGLEGISGGEIRIGGDLMNRLPPRQRDLAMVFQSYALYPHMTVMQNLTYSLRLKGVDRKTAEHKAREAAETTGLSGLLERYPRELSGGQRQRVAMGRAIIRHPKAFLFDEPLSNLDAALRVHMRKEIRSLHNRLGATSVYVTHDQIEAMTMADHVVVLRDGIIEQQGAPLELYDSPANRFVAGFIGSPAMNFLAGTVAETGDTLSLDLGDDQSLPLPRKLEPGRRLVAGLRPEHIETEGQEKGIALPVLLVEHTGATSLITTDTDPQMTVLYSGRSTVHNGETVTLGIAGDKLHLFDEETGAVV